MNRRWLVVAVGVSLVASVSGGAVGAVPARAASVRECDVTGESDRFPVVLIHGFATKSEKIARDWKPASDAITAAGGQPVLFDWAGESWDWVTKKGAEKRLRSSIECLAAKAGGPVFVVAHSMGGLLLRAAFQDGLDTRLVAGAVTIGTPHEGIWLDQTGMEVVKAAIAGVCLGSLVGLAVCAGPLGGQVTNLFSGAVAGMTAGSTELSQLKPWPDLVPATFIAGELTLCKTTFLLELGCENKGRDPLVKVDSALASTTVSAPNISRVTIKCKTSWAHFIADLPTDLDHVPCSHGPLRRQPETLTAITTMVDRKACTARNLFAAAVAKEQIDPNDPAYEALLEYGEGPQASDVICNADWATATVSRPQVGTTDGTTLFHLGNDNIWTEVAIIGNPVVDCRLVAEGVPPNIASILAPTDAQFLADNPGICPGTTALTSDPVLGLANWSYSSDGFGVARPARVHFGGDPTGLIDDVAWSAWGGTTAEGEGTGINEANSVDGTVAGAPAEPAHIVAWDLGICGGKSAYRKVNWYFAGEQWSPTDDSYDICQPG